MAEQHRQRTKRLWRTAGFLLRLKLCRATRDDSRSNSALPATFQRRLFPLERLQTVLSSAIRNSAALSPNNLGGNALFTPNVKNNPRITQYYVPGEVLTNLDNADLFDARPGSKIAIPGR